MNVIWFEAPHSLEGKVIASPSKSYTHRAIFAASLAAGNSGIEEYLASGDTLSTMRVCRAFGARIEESKDLLSISGVDRPETPDDVVNVENSGTTLRIATSILGCTSSGFSVLTGDESIRKRPMGPLISALSKLGVEVWSTRGNGSAPLVVKGGGMRGGETEIEGQISSQFISSILISSPLSEKGVRLLVKDAVSRPYIDSTIYVLDKFGIRIERDGYAFFEVRPQDFRACRMKIPGDFSSSSFLLAASALVGGRVKIGNLESSCPQADSAIIDVMTKMGVKIKANRDTVVVMSDGGKLGGCALDLTDSPDLLPVVSVLALRSDSGVEIRGVKHARFKETDRIHIIASELTKIGAIVKEFENGLAIRPPREIRKAVLDPHGDHRLFMAFLVASLISKGISVIYSNIDSISYPGFLSDMKKIGVRVVTRQV